MYFFRIVITIRSKLICCGIIICIAIELAFIEKIIFFHNKLLNEKKINREVWIIKHHKTVIKHQL